MRDESHNPAGVMTRGSQSGVGQCSAIKRHLGKWFIQKRYRKFRQIGQSAEKYSSLTLSPTRAAWDVFEDIGIWKHRRKIALDLLRVGLSLPYDRYILTE